MNRLLIGVYRYLLQHRLWMVVGLLGLCVCMAVIASRLHIETDITRALPGGGQAQQVNDILRSARFSDKLIIRIQLTDSATASEVLTDCGESLDSTLHGGEMQPYIADVKGKTNEETTLALYQFIRSHLPLYLHDSDYRHIDTLIDPATITHTLERNYHTLTTATGLALKQMIADDPVGISSLALRKLATLQVNSDFDLYNGFIATRDHRSIVFFITPLHPSGDTKANAILLQQLYDWSAVREQSQQGLHISIYGGTAVAISNAEQLHRDMLLTLSITIVGLLALIWFFFRRRRVPFIMLLPVVFGVLFALAMIALHQSSVSVIAIAAGSIVLGIAINYSLHFLTHYRHCGSIEETLRELWIPMTLGSATTILSLFALTFVQSPILHDFGLFAGFSLMGAAVFTLLLLPQFIPTDMGHGVNTPRFLDRLIQFQPRRPHWWVVGIFIVTIGFATQIHKVAFETDMNTLSYLTPKLKEAEIAINALTNSQPTKTVYLAATGSNENEALQHNRALALRLDTLLHQGIVARAASISNWVLDEHSQKQKIATWNDYWTTDRKAKLIATLHAQGATQHFSPNAFVGFDTWLQGAFRVIPIDSFKPILSTIGNDWLIHTPSTHAAISSVAVPLANRKLLFDLLDPDKNIVILDKQRYTSKLIDVIFTDFNQILYMTSLLVFIALLMSYGRIELTIITFLPMLISWIWILGIMGLLGLKFNIINIIISTFIFGLGDDFAIFNTDGLSSRYQYGRDTLPTHRTSIFLGAATTLLGLGVLVLAQHPALRSIAIISMIGIFCVLLIGQILQPILYNFYIQHRRDKGYPPYTFYYLIITMIEFGYFAIASMLLTITGFILIKVLPFPNLKTRRYWLHWLISKYMWTLVYIPFRIKKNHIGKASMDWSKPAILIANHSSYLDILVTVMQHPKLILLTNDWVYHSPIFGRVVQLAEYYPIREGTEVAIARLLDKVADGYSIVVFPEGTRSTDGRIGRFHKGAFYLAEKLGMDIVPLLLHGTGDRVRKGTFMLMDDGPVTIKYLPRIAPDDISYGVTCSERTKAISRYFKTEYEKLKTSIEQPRYFRKRLLLNYIYKGFVLEWYYRQKINIENDFESYHRLLPTEGCITDIGCGYGFMIYMLHYLSDKRVLTGVDFDEDKIATATHAYSKSDKTTFLHADVTTYQSEPQDAFVISDVLHYLTQTEQEQLLKRCIDALLPNGIILIREGNASDKKHKATWWTEFFSINLGFNRKQHTQLYFTSEERLRVICDTYSMQMEIIRYSKSTSNTLYLLRKAP